jgi:hypothetical protein
MLVRSHGCLSILLSIIFLCLMRSSFFLIGIVGGGVQLGPLGTAATNRLIMPAPGDYDGGEISRMMIGKGNRSTRRKPAPVPLCPPQTPHPARTRNRVTAVGSQRITAWDTARPWGSSCSLCVCVNVSIYMCVSLSFSHLIFSFYMRSVSCQRKVGD